MRLIEPSVKAYSQIGTSKRASLSQLPVCRKPEVAIANEMVRRFDGTPGRIPRGPLALGMIDSASELTGPPAGRQSGHFGLLPDWRSSAQNPAFVPSLTFKSFRNTVAVNFSRNTMSFP
jgi:hypothetical protein